jgi:hypothetical protein
MPHRRRVAGVGARSAAFLVVLQLCCLAVARADDVCAPRVEENRQWQSASFRPHSDAFRRCPVAEETYRRVVGEWLAQRDDPAEPVKSLSLGRLVDHPWLSGYLAEAAQGSAEWDARRGRARSGNDNALVGTLLSRPEILQRLRQPFEGSGFSVTRVSVEKVLSGGPGGVAVKRGERAPRLPFDAQTWLVLERRE